MFVVRPGQAVEGQRFEDVGFDPIDQLRILGLPFADPRRQISLGFLDVAPVIDPAQFLKAIVVGLARQIALGIAQEMHITALPCGFRQHHSDRFLEAGMIVGNDKFDAREATLLQAQQEVFPTALTLAVRHFDR